MNELTLGVEVQYRYHRPLFGVVQSLCPDEKGYLLVLFGNELKRVHKSSVGKTSSRSDKV